jgi:hypothetical protein
MLSRIPGGAVQCSAVQCSAVHSGLVADRSSTLYKTKEISFVMDN